MSCIAFIVLSAFLLINVSLGSDTQCEFTRHDNSNGFCVRNRKCCKDFIIDNLCSNGMVCCFGRYDCSGQSNQDPEPGRSCPTINSRNSWKARNPSSTLSSIRPVQHIFIHHTDDGNTCEDQHSCETRIRRIQSDNQLNKKWKDIAWNFLIGGDGQVYEGIGWNKEGFHTLNWNQKSLGIAFIGQYNSETPSDGQLDALEDLIDCGLSKGYIQTSYRLHGHRDALSATKCPGDNLYDAISEIKNFQAGPLD